MVWNFKRIGSQAWHPCCTVVQLDLCKVHYKFCTSCSCSSARLSLLQASGHACGLKNMTLSYFTQVIKYYKTRGFSTILRFVYHDKVFVKSNENIIKHNIFDIFFLDTAYIFSYPAKARSYREPLHVWIFRVNVHMDFWTWPTFDNDFVDQKIISGAKSWPLNYPNADFLQVANISGRAPDQAWACSYLYVKPVFVNGHRIFCTVTPHGKPCRRLSVCARDQALPCRRHYVRSTTLPGRAKNPSHSSTRVI